MVTRTLSAGEVWQTALGELQLQLPRETFDTWLRSARLIAHEDGTFIIGVHNIYAREWLEQRLKPPIMRTLRRIAQRSVEVRFVTAPENRPKAAAEDLDEAGPLLATAMKEKVEAPQHEVGDVAHVGLNHRLTFDTFAVGACNRLAHAAAVAVVDAPASQFNPLYINAGVGLGKTHLLHAIGNAAHRCGQRVLFITAETFTNDMVNAIKSKTTGDFRNKYREVDLLLVDDIQFLAGKNSTQEEFLHTFNALINANAQVVVAAGTPAGEIPKLDPRLRSRFEGGLAVELQAPDVETRIGILELKARARALNSRMPRELLEKVAGEVEGSVRELEGALNRLIAVSLLTNEAPTADEAEEVLEDLQTSSQSAEEELEIEDIVASVAEAHGVSEEDLLGRSRKRNVSVARQVVMYIAYKEAEMSLQAIGEVLDGRNHSTVSYGCKRVEELMAEDAKLRRQVQDLVRSLRSRPGHEDKSKHLSHLIKGVPSWSGNAVEA